MYKAYVKGYGYGREYPHNTYLGYLGVLEYFTNLNLGAIKGDDFPQSNQWFPVRYWLVVSTHLKNMNQVVNWDDDIPSNIWGKHVPNRQPNTHYVAFCVWKLVG